MKTKKNQNTFTPSDQKEQFILFVDELNMPTVEKYGAQPPLQLLRQYMDDGGWYDLDSRQKKNFQGLNLVAAMNTRNPPSRRFIQHFNILYADSFKDESLNLIFVQVFGQHLNQFNQFKELQSWDIPLVSSLVELFNCIQQTPLLMPTPQKSHYSLNMRDLSRIVQGLCLSNPQNVQNDYDLVQIWIHQCCRVFKDRLVQKVDYDAFDKLLRQIIKTKLMKAKLDNEAELGTHETQIQMIKKKFQQEIFQLGTKISFKSILYTNLEINPNNYISQTNQYTLVDKIDSVKELLKEKMKEYIQSAQQSGITLNQLIFFDEAVRHIFNIMRVLSIPFGHSLLIGMGGSGRNSLTQLSGYLSGMKYNEINTSSDWRDQFSKILTSCGLESKQNLFVVNDSKLFSNQILQDISQYLNSGDIPDLWSLQERLQIGESIINSSNNNKALKKIFDALESDKEEESKEEKQRGNKKTAQKKDKKIVQIEQDVVDKQQEMASNQFQVFMKSLRTNFHLVVILSPQEADFQKNVRNFPALINCTTINWFMPWPTEAFVSTASNLLDQQNSLLVDFANRKQTVVTLVQGHHLFLRLSQKLISEQNTKLIITPMNFIRLIEHVNRLANVFETKNNELIERYQKGVERISATDIELSHMRQELFNLNVELEQKTTENLELLEILKENQKNADKKKEICEIEEKNTQIQKQEAEQLQNQCNIQLSRVLPMLEEANQALEQISKDDLTKLKSYAHPAESVQIVTEALCYVLGVDHMVPKKPVDPLNPYGEIYLDFWEYSQQFLLNDQLIKLVQEFKEDQIKAIRPDQMKKLIQIVNDPLFDKEKVFQGSQAAGNFSLWIRAICSTNDALNVVEPKRIQLQVAREKFQIASKLLEEKVLNLNQSLQQISKLQDEYVIACATKDELEKNVNTVQKQLIRAEQLLIGLEFEKKNWIQKEINCAADIRTTLGDSIVSAQILTYFGMFPISLREEARSQLNKFLDEEKIQLKKSYDFSQLLSDPITISMWVSKQKLPNDKFSIENAVILQNEVCWSVCIDPQNQGIKWIKQMERESGLRSLTASMPKNEFLLQLENCFELGLPVLLDNVGEQINPAFIAPLVFKEWKRQANGFQLLMNSKQYEVKLDFRLYLISKLSKANFSSEISSQLALINFTVTDEGLTDQLLNRLIQIEKPDEENLRIKNINQLFEIGLNTDQLEKNILFLISNYQGDDLLSDQKLIQALEVSRNETQSMNEKKNVLRANQQDLETTRNYYRAVARLCSSIFFMIMDLSSIEYLYQYSLEWYTQLFINGLLEAASSDLKPTFLFNNFNKQDSKKFLISQVNQSKSKKLIEDDNTPKSFGEKSIEFSTLDNQNQSEILEKQKQQKLKSIDPYKELFTLPIAIRYREFIIKKLTLSIYNNICRSLVEKDQLLFSFMLCTRIQLLEGKINLSELQFFAQGSSSNVDDELLERKSSFSRQNSKSSIFHNSPKSSISSGSGDNEIGSRKSVLRILGSLSAASLANTNNPLKQLISIKQWNNLNYLIGTIINQPVISLTLPRLIDQFNAVFVKIFRNQSLFSEFLQQEIEEQIFNQFPDSANKEQRVLNELTHFQRIMIGRVIRPDQSLYAMQKFIEKTIGKEFVDIPAVNLEEAYKESDSKTPIIYITTTGIDPIIGIQGIGSKLNFQDKILVISLGQGQEKQAQRALKEGIVKGLWIVLQNCHLVPSFNPVLENLYQNWGEKNHAVSQNFRLWLTLHTTPNFPNSILQRGIKIRTEKPQGLKNNMLLSISMIRNELRFTQMHEKFPKGWQRLFFCMCFFHSMIQERKQFGPIGWNKPYQFSIADLSSSLHNISLILQKNSSENSLNFTAIKYLVCETIYGGKISEPQDRRLINIIFDRFFNLEMFQSKFSLSKKQNSLYQIPLFSNKNSDFIRDQIQIIEAYPHQDPCDIFGMHDNAQISGEILNSSNLLNTLLTIIPKIDNFSKILTEDDQTIRRNKSILQQNQEPEGDPVIEWTESQSDSSSNISENDASSQLGEQIETNIVESKSSEQQTESQLKIQQSNEKTGSNITISGIINNNEQPRIRQSIPKSNKSKLQSVRLSKASIQNFVVPSSKEKSVKDICLRYLNMLPDLFDMAQAYNQFPLDYSESMNTVLLQELMRFNQLLSIVKSSLKSVIDTIEGINISNNEIQIMTSKINENVVPIEWQKFSYPSNKPLQSWVIDLIERLKFFTIWLQEGIPTKFWVSGFFFTQSFLTGVAQNYSRTNKQTIDSIKFKFEILNDIEEPSVAELDKKQQDIILEKYSQSVIGYGLFIEGANWNSQKRCIMDPEPGVLYYQLPPIVFIPYEHTDEEQPMDHKTMPCPLYKTSQRIGEAITGIHSNYIIDIDLPIGEINEMKYQDVIGMWVTRGLALLCQLDD